MDNQLKEVHFTSKTTPFLLRLELFSVFSRRNTKFFLEGVGEMVLTAETNILRNLFDGIFGKS